MLNNRGHSAAQRQRLPIRSQSPGPSDLPTLVDVPCLSDLPTPVNEKKKKKKTPKLTSAANVIRLQQSAREDEHEQQRQQRHETENLRRAARPPREDTDHHWTVRCGAPARMLHQPGPGRRNVALSQQERELRAEVVRLAKNKEDTLGGTSPLLKGTSAAPATGSQLIVTDKDGVTDAFEGFDRIESGDEEPVPEEVEDLACCGIPPSNLNSSLMYLFFVRV